MKIDFVTRSIKEYLWRAKGSFIAEPLTMEWLRNTVGCNDVLYDVGSNVGAYSLYFGRKIITNSGTGKVISFEPEAQNYSALNQNIVKNKLSGIITPFSLAISDRCGIFQFELSSFTPGSATHQLRIEGNSSIEYCHLQGAMAVSLDDFIYRYSQPVPNHIKIDVDGLEDKVTLGMEQLLKDQV